MLLLHDRATMLRALTLDLDPRLIELLRSRIEHTFANDLTDETEILVIMAGDSEFDVAREVGFSPLIEPINDGHYGEPGFAPYWDRLTNVGGCWEMIVTFGSTQALILLVQDADGVLPELRALCREFAENGA